MSKLVYYDCEFVNEWMGHRPGTKSSIIENMALDLEKRGTIRILSKPQEQKPEKPQENHEIPETPSSPQNQQEEVNEQEEKAIESSPVDKMVENAPKNKMVGSSPRNKSVKKSKK